MRHQRISNYLIDDNHGSPNGLKVWFRSNGIEIDTEVMEIEQAIKDLKRQGNHIKSEQYRNSEFYLPYKPEDNLWEDWQ